ncbi:MAG: efflux transporter periplasmic adaptor subunit [Sphingomonas bacterium]|nr:efflux transporter periplasmic adaptor subunit [Sphingomonas bacterium]
MSVRWIMVALALGGCAKPAAEEETAPTPVALVGVAPVEQGAVRETVTLYGTAENGAGANAVLAAPAEAIVATVDAPVGTAVRAGQVVVRLRPSATVQLDIAKVSSDATAARLALARAQRLRADGLVGDAEVEAARAAAATATATLTSLTTRSGSLNLRAPAAGYVQTIANSPGDLVAAGAAVATIAKAGDLRGRFGVDPALARRLPAGASVRIAPAAGGASFGAPVLSVDPVVDPQTRLASVFVRIPAASGIGAGEPLSGEVLIGASGNALTIPYAALLDEGGQPFVYVVTRGVARRRDIVTTPGSGDRVPVTSGLTPGEIVVTQGATGLEDGMKVRTR